MNTFSYAIAALADVRLLIGGGLLAVGGLLLLLAALGQTRLPDVYARIHALTPFYTWGGALVLGALAVGVWDGRFAVRALLLAALTAVIGPALSYMIANGAHASGLAPRVGKLDPEDPA